MPLALVLADDPARNREFDLQRALLRCDATRLALRVEPQTSGDETDAAAGAALAAACAVTAGHPVDLPAYRLHRMAGKKPVASVESPAAAIAAALAEAVPPPFALVVFVSPATLPLIEALHADAGTSPGLRVGITGWRLDPDYNLAQKLVAQRKLHYHEHAKMLDRLLCDRLARMLREHASVTARRSTTTAATAAVAETPSPDSNPRSETP